MAADDPAARIVGRIAGLVVVAGLAVTLGAVAWWATFYGGVAGPDGHGGLAGVVRCVWSNRGACGVASGMARGAGKLAYTPTLFWLGVSLLLAGIAARLALSRRAERNG